MSDVRDQLERLADASPAPTGTQRDREIHAAVLRAGSPAVPALPARRAWPWLVAGAAVLAAAALALWLVARGPGAPDRGPELALHDAGVIGDASAVAVASDAPGDIAELVVERGVAAPVGVVVEAREDTVLRAGRTRVEAAIETRFARDAADASRWRLERGTLALRVAERTTVEVATPEARIVVVGSQFVVGRYASETVVEVAVGEVLVTPVDGGEAVTVHAGERWPAAPVLADAGVPTRDAGAAPPARDAGGRVPVLRFDATIIRRTIREGKVGDAREMIEASRAQHASSKRTLAELGILAAEADLAERETRSAIGKYLDVVRDFAATPQAEQALFAAAQLAIGRPDAGYRAEALLEDYLTTYPKGQFAKDAERLLGTLKK